MSACPDCGCPSGTCRDCAIRGDATLRAELATAIKGRDAANARARAAERVVEVARAYVKSAGVHPESARGHELLSALHAYDAAKVAT